MILGAGILTFFAGIVCFWDSELAWRLYELDSRTIGIQVEKPDDWRERVRYMGVNLILLGLLALVAAIKMY